MWPFSEFVPSAAACVDKASIWDFGCKTESDKMETRNAIYLWWPSKEMGWD